MTSNIYNRVFKINHILHKKLSYCIRLANTWDIPSIDSCNRRNLPENYERSMFQQHLRAWSDLSLVAETDSNEIIGYALGKIDLKDNNTCSGHIFSIAVETHFRRCGLARNLLVMLHQNMVKLPNLSHVNLLCRSSNSSAISLYKNKFNYNQSELKHEYYQDGEDAWYLEVSRENLLSSTGMLEIDNMHQK